MGDIDKARNQRDAQRTAAGRQTAAQARTDYAFLRYLGVELYEERRRAERAADKPVPDDPADQESAS